MTAHDPAARPTAAEAWEQWRTLSRRPLLPLGKLWRLRGRKESIGAAVFFDLFALCQLSIRLPLVPFGRARLS